MPRIHNPEIDHSQGHAFLHNGEVFYSPNSSRRIIIPNRPGPSLCYRFHKEDAFSVVPARLGLKALAKARLRRAQACRN
jgi:hypothetical protein